jgi:alpha-D-xyloside xylohydrolase
MKYRLMPYVYAQAKDCSERGLPMLRALFVEFPDDPGSWSVDDEYLFGSSLLVAPLLHENANSRNVYLPPGTWIDYQTGKACEGGWRHLEAGPIAAIILVRDGTVIPRIKLAQSTMQMDWSRIELMVYARDAKTAKGLVCLPSDNRLHELTLTRQGNTFKLASDALAGKVTWQIRLYSEPKSP